MSEERLKFQSYAAHHVLNGDASINYLFVGIKQFFLTLALLLLTGCVSYHPLTPEAARNKQMWELSQQLAEADVRVLQTGQTIRIILYSDQLFNLHSANFQRSAPSVLDKVARFMRLLEATSVQVTGYTNAELSAGENKALSLRQAQMVTDYIWSNGVDARLMYSVGYGEANQMAPNLPGSLANGTDRRIEIQFGYLPLLSSLVN